MFFTVFAIGFIVFHVTAVQFPSYIHVCGRRHPNLDKCISDNVENMKEACRIGIPELKLPSYQPLYLDTMTLFNSSSIKAVLKNTYVNGMCDYKVNFFHTDVKNKHFDIDFIFNRIDINGTYNLDIRILVPIVASETMFITTENMLAKVGMDYKTVKKNHTTRVYISEIQLNLDIKEYDLSFGKIESNTSVSELHKILHSVIGNNKEEMLKSTKPYIEQAITKVIFNSANGIVTLYTYDQLFPDRE